MTTYYYMYSIMMLKMFFIYRLDMAQYLGKIAMDNIFAAGILLSSEQILQYRCPLCKHLLDNPLQAECGDRFCSDCFKTTFTDKLVVQLFCTFKCTQSKVHALITCA